MFGQYLSYGVLSAAIGTVFYANLPTRITLGNISPTAKYLADGILKQINSEKDVLTAKEIKAETIFQQSPVLVMAVRRPGCAFCRRQASELSKISDQINQSGVRLIGVLHETTGADEFKPFLKGDLYYDAKKHFFGPKERWMPLWMGFFRLSTYINGRNTKKEGFSGDFVGEGRLLGGIYLVNKNEVIYSHLEQEWGELVSNTEILNAIKKI